MIELGPVGVLHSDPPSTKLAAFFRLLAHLAPDRASSYMTALVADDPDLFYRLHTAGGARPTDALGPGTDDAPDIGLDERTRNLREMLDEALGDDYRFDAGGGRDLGAESDEYGFWPQDRGVLGTIDSLVGVLGRVPTAPPEPPAHSLVRVTIDVRGPVGLTGSGGSDLEAISDALGQLWHYGFAGRFVLRDAPHGKELAVFHETNGLTA